MAKFSQLFVFLIIKLKSRHKWSHFTIIVLSLLLILLNLCSEISCKCNETSEWCMNGGICKNETCICADGWQGSKCQFCGGKVRLTELSGSIHDGAENYAIGVKCSWLIDARKSVTSGGGANQAISAPISTKTDSIRLHLEEFATECGWDHLYVYDGDSVESPLLAVFSGLMYNQNFSIRRVPEVVAHSGSALLHFFSDDAYNMSGFNISYKVNGCPTIDSSLNCSGHGVCVDGTCTCDASYMGEACHVPKCPNNCSYDIGRGHCDQEAHMCACNPGYAGSDCTQLTALGYWSTISTTYFTPNGSASHGAAVYFDTLYIIAGESYGRGNLLTMYDFNGKVWEVYHNHNHNEKDILPEMRYGASTVINGDKIFMYGGVIGNKGVCGELWTFDISAKNWENITVKTEPCNITNTMCGPLKSAGHTATIISGYIPEKKEKIQYMVVIFGHSPQFGYLNTVQEFHFGTREWKIVQTKGFPVKGGYGHSAAYDSLTEKIFVYGGIISESESSQLLSNKLYSYEPGTRTWTLLTSASSARYLHTSNFISPGLMMTFGGNTHNDTSHSFGAKCYSHELLVYDVLCDSWHSKPMPNDLRTDLARFGHTAVIFEKSLYIFGGFDGQMLNDMLKFTPGTCENLTRLETCLNTKPGVKCIWDIQRSQCINVSESHRKILFKDQDVYEVCQKETRNVATKLHILDSNRCKEIVDCQSCLSTSFGCTYCSAGVCSKEKYREDSFTLNGTKSLDQCPDDASPICLQLHGCQICSSNPLCYWDIEATKCRAIGNKTIGETNDLPCPPSCSALTSCGNCTQEECIWCQNEQRCVDKNAYTASFPYGQCREWTTMSSRCRAAMTGKSQCGFYKTCSQCRDDPACGWCDDGSNTGMGKCLLGGDRGPQDEMECSNNRWHFTNCPSCQCNGHSTCPDNTTCKQPCGNLTTGLNCDKCEQGYWGNPVNGGKCEKCQCNEQATKCHSETGKCYCSTKGLIGDHCEKCDATNHYHGDPLKGSCYYDLTIDYQFTFNLSKKEDHHFTQINFRNSPIKSDIDADFIISCSVAAKMNITIRTLNEKEKPLFTGINCTQFRYRFSKQDYHFGIENNLTSTTFYVYVYDFHPPLWIQIAFSQYPKLNLQQFFITFSTCFFMLLLLAALLWKIKQRYDMYRRRQRLFVEMEQMASRPFSNVIVEIENRERHEFSPNIETITNANKKRKKDGPSPIALEPCYGNRAAVLSLLVRLPTGGLQHSPPGQAAGLAVASALVTLGNARRPSLEHPKEPKSKRKQSQHPDSCI